MLVAFLIASAITCTVELIPETKSCRRCCTTGAVSACRFIQKCSLPPSNPEQSPQDQNTPKRDSKDKQQ